MMVNWGYGPGMGNFYGGGFFQILFWAAIIGLGIYLFRRSGNRISTGRSFRVEHSTSALNILRERYARGEIERDEYEQKVHDLKD